MKFIIFFYLFAITTINPIVNAHENHDHQIYNWSNSKNKTIKINKTVNSEKLENKKNKSKSKTESILTNFFKKINQIPK